MGLLTAGSCMAPIAHGWLLGGAYVAHSWLIVLAHVWLPKEGCPNPNTGITVL
jgi:hypothetical protein